MDNPTSERWRETYDQWKLATPPEHEGGDEMDEWDEYDLRYADDDDDKDALRSRIETVVSALKLDGQP